MLQLWTNRLGFNGMHAPLFKFLQFSGLAERTHIFNQRIGKMHLCFRSNPPANVFQTDISIRDIPLKGYFGAGIVIDCNHLPTSHKGPIALNLKCITCHNC